jgi:hypothetical protein
MLPGADRRCRLQQRVSVPVRLARFLEQEADLVSYLGAGHSEAPDLL